MEEGGEAMPLRTEQTLRKSEININQYKTMKESYIIIWKWFKNLNLWNKIKVIWFYVNVCLCMCIVEADIVPLLVFMVNLILSAFAIKTVDTKPLDKLMDK